LFARISRLHPLLRILLAAIAIVVVLVFSLGMRKSGPDGRKTWSPLKDPSTVVLSPPEIAKIWEWEVLSGHHPSLAEGE
jgi:WD repeat and SOF domain-containing protein 1